MIYALSIHADYRCQHSGVCCSSDWDVPVEVPLYRTLEDALRAGRVAVAAQAEDDAPSLVVADEMPDEAGAMVSRTSTGDCVFYHRHSGLCVIHRDLGEPSLPATCRYFPRLAVSDSRGVFISLTHYCPTAAGMLFRDEVPIAIVENPAAFPPADYEGLTVGADEWPPLLHPRMLMDGAGYSAWERHMVARCADVRFTPEGVITALRRDAEIIRSWNPQERPLEAEIALLDCGASLSGSPREPEGFALRTLGDSLALHAEAMQAVPEDLRPDADVDRLEDEYVRNVLPHWPAWGGPLKRYLAAKAFASWTAYQGRGVLTIVRGLEAALALVRVEAARQCRDEARPLDADLLKEAIRQADFILNHLAVGEDLAEAWSAVEIHRD